LIWSLLDSYFLRGEERCSNLASPIKKEKEKKEKGKKKMEKCACCVLSGIISANHLDESTRQTG
jgi:hypothetical protein